MCHLVNILIRAVCWMFAAFLLVLSPESTFAQKENNPYGNFHLGIAPFRSLELVNPGVEVAFAWQYSSKWATGISATYLTDLFGTAIFEDYNGYRVGVEQRWFWFQKRSWFRLFGSLELVHHYSTFQRTATFYTPEYMNDPSSADEVQYFEETFGIRRQMFNVSPRVGIQVMISSWLYLEAAGGWGIKYRNIRHIDRQADARNEYNPDANPVWPGLRRIGVREGNAWHITLPVHARIGVRF